MQLDVTLIKSRAPNGFLSAQTAVVFPPKQRVARSTRANRTSKFKASREIGRPFWFEAGVIRKIGNKYSNKSCYGVL